MGLRVGLNSLSLKHTPAAANSMIQERQHKGAIVLIASSFILLVVTAVQLGVPGIGEFNSNNAGINGECRIFLVSRADSNRLGDVQYLSPFKFLLETRLHSES
jgi:hypothetical protein